MAEGVVTSNENLGGPSGRQPASGAFRTKAHLLRKQADDLETIARALDDCVPAPTEDGSEEIPSSYIGVGSPAEEALWRLAISIRF
jgi:hypothetical protein